MHPAEVLIISINGAAVTIAGFGALGVTNVIKMSTEAAWNMLLTGGLTAILTTMTSAIYVLCLYLKNKVRR
jgi:hypothetical protein